MQSVAIISPEWLEKGTVQSVDIISRDGEKRVHCSL